MRSAVFVTHVAPGIVVVKEPDLVRGIMADTEKDTGTRVERGRQNNLNLLFMKISRTRYPILQPRV